MRRLLAPLAACAFVVLPASSAPLDPSSFEALAEGHTLHFSRDGAPYGAEQYFPGRRSLWQFADGACADGVWWPEGDRVCFRYGAGMEPECWRFEAGPRGVSVRPSGGSSDGSLRTPDLVLDLARVDRVPLDCPGPDVGT